MKALSLGERKELINDLLSKKISLISENPSLTRFLTQSGCDDNLFKFVTLLGKGGYGNVYAIDLPEISNRGIAIKIGADPDIDIPESGYNTEIEIMMILQQFLARRETPHLPIFVGDYMCKKDKEYIRYIILEQAAGSIIASKHSLSSIKNLLFQIIWTLAVIQNKYPGFRHNDLKWDNILYIEGNWKGVTQYNWKDRSYFLPNIGIRALISDFGMSTIPNITNNMLTMGISLGNVGVDQRINRWIDISKLLTRVMIIISTKLDDPMYRSFEQFIQRTMIPLTSSYWTKYSTPVIDYEYKTMMDILFDPFFATYTIPRDDVTDVYTLDSNGISGEPELIIHHQIKPICPTKFLLPVNPKYIIYKRDNCPTLPFTPVKLNLDKISRVSRKIIIDNLDIVVLIQRNMQPFLDFFNTEFIIPDYLANKVYALAMDYAGYYTLGVHLINLDDTSKKLKISAEWIIHRSKWENIFKKIRLPWSNILKLITPAVARRIIDASASKIR